MENVLSEQQFKSLVDQFGKEAAGQVEEKFKAWKVEAEKLLEQHTKGMISKDELTEKIKEALGDVRESLKKLETIATEQGNAINDLKDNGSTSTVKTIDEILEENAPKIKEMYKAGGFIEIPLTNVSLKTAGIFSIGNTVQPMSAPPNSPYMPGIGGPGLEIFETIYNPNFAMNFVNMGRTNLANLAWANETTTEGGAAVVQEGALKPVWSTRFDVELSKAEKIAAMATITEEFDEDMPGFTTLVKRLLMNEVMRKFDDAIYAAVIAAATGYTLTGLNGKIDDPNFWDAIGAGLAQVAKNNYVANLIALNPVTMWEMWMTKTAVERQYQSPPFLAQIQSKLAESNKVAEGHVLIADARFFNVDVVKQPVLKVGWNMDDFQRNQFSVVAEVRYHKYISTARKNALIYYNLAAVKTQIDSGS